MKPREHASVAVACSLAGDVVRTFGDIRLRVFGTSMVPTILPGDLIFVQRNVPAEISSGEIVLYAREGRMFVHRVVGRAGGPDHSLLVTRGDLLQRSDPPVSSSELLGKVISIERGGRQLKTTSAPGDFSRSLVRLLQTSGRATYLYVKVASCWQKFVSQTFSLHRKNGLAGAGVNAANRGMGGAATPYYDENSQDEQIEIDARLRPQETEGAAKCQA
jgi:signal peptidase I